MANVRAFVTSRWFVGIAGLLIGALVVLGIRFATYAPEHVHYHANFAVYVGGVREEFKAKKYYEEVTICSVDGTITTPQQRVHLHDEDNAAVHVHDGVVTWGDFFANLGWHVGPTYISTDDGRLLQDDGTNVVSVLIDGNPITPSSLSTRVIEDRDRLLVSYGTADTATLRGQSDSVPTTAAKYDTAKDPASCGGDAPVTFSQRIDHLFTY